MALTLNLPTSQFGVPFNAAYFRIVTATVSRTRNPESRFSVMIDVAGYGCCPETDDTREIDFRRYHVPYTEVADVKGDDIFQKCYGWIAAQPDMVGCLQA